MQWWHKGKADLCVGLCCLHGGEGGLLSLVVWGVNPVLSRIFVVEGDKDLRYQNG